ncbi:MAG TPA: alkaline phosphatase D family protein [Burkholderiales bacterium]|nr:alkaline phosphatase D family protein [Burkholderiales bacterium]
MNQKFLAELLHRAAPIEMPPSQRRRAVLKLAARLAVSAVLAPAASLKAWAQPRFSAYPFTLGVASGSPRPNGFVLWTRLAPDPLTGGGTPPEPVELRWEIARDRQFRDIAQQGVVRAMPNAAHSVRFEVSGLEPSRWYWYRFMAGDAMSPLGRTRTAPAQNAAVERLAFAFASCQQYEQGYFAAHRHMAREDLDFVVFLGDYIYESSWGRNHVRKHNAGEPYTLDGYRDRYALYKSDPDLQHSHASAPWIVTWDDHEVQNDYANDQSQDLDPDFLTRRAAAYQAFFEHMPLAHSALPRGPEALIYDRYIFGDLATCFVLDDRQYRSHEACPKPGRGGSTVVTDCAERLLPERTMLGSTQQAWLKDGLVRSRARWNIIAQQTLMAQNDRKPGPGQSFWTDGWDGYPAARARLLNDIAQSRASNPLVIGGDVHCTWVADLKPDFDDPQSPVVATEFCGTSITSQGPSQKQVEDMLAENPHLRYGNGTKRGYVKMEIQRDRCTATLRALSYEKRADSGIATAATFVVESGRPGAQQV